jgi:Flp pilus assembly pilin Flp
MPQMFHTASTDESGQTMAEYSVVVAVIAVVVALVLPQLASAIGAFFTAAIRALGG